jgi:hypothetical protein
MIRLTGTGAVQDRPVLVDETLIRFVGPAGDANDSTIILQQDSDAPILVKESVDQIEQAMQEAKK